MKKVKKMYKISTEIAGVLKRTRKRKKTTTINEMVLEMMKNEKRTIQNHRIMLY